MSQEYSNSVRRSRRTVRSQRNRPVLVMADSDVTSDQLIQEPSPTEEVETQVAEAEQPVQPATKGRRLPNFFSTVGKVEKEETTQEVDVAKARLARATRHKIVAVSETTKKSGKETTTAKNTPTVSSKARPATQQPTSPFKTRHIIGIAIYLLVANFVGLLEKSALDKIHADVVLTSFPLFGSKIIVTTSTLVFLLTLIAVLIILARLDLIPRSLGGTMAGKPASRASVSKSSSDGGERAPQPTMKQGIKGDDDDLYHAYRANQRREKKR